MHARNHIKNAVHVRGRAVRVLTTESSREASEKLYLVRGRMNAGAVKMFLHESRGGVSLSSFRFARSSWLSGLARILDIGGTFTAYNRGSTAAETDWFALASDTEMISRDFWAAVKSYTDENRSAVQKRKTEIDKSDQQDAPTQGGLVSHLMGVTPEERCERLKARINAYQQRKLRAAAQQRLFKERYLICAQRNRVRAEVREKSLV
jgi:hypothetical protein